VALAPVATHAVVFVRAPEASGARLVAIDLGASHARHSVDPGGPSGLPRGALHLDGLPADAAALLAAGEAATLAHGRLRDNQHVLAGALATGLARSALARTLGAARDARPSSQATEFALADMATLVDASELSVRNAAWLSEREEPFTLEASSAKLVATRAATRVVHAALGICSDTPAMKALEAAYLDARFLETHYGADAVQIDRIASELLEERR
jgi:butyryl-CoA dehydrogenase